MDVKRVKCEIYSRVCGYFRPVESWNEGKQSEYKDRKMFKAEAKNENSKKDSK
jgi:anaerobic ribonucleoside-triphosphate reductase